MIDHVPAALHDTAIAVCTVQESCSCLALHSMVRHHMMGMVQHTDGKPST